MTNNYTTSTDAFADIAEGNYASSDYGNMDTLVAVASRLIDLDMGVWPGYFYPTTDDVTRYYDGSGTDEQRIDSFVSIASVSVAEEGGTASTDYTAWSSSDYILWPYNYSADGKPISKLIVDWNGSKAIFYRFRKSVQVVGVAGYAATTPAPIEQACKIQSLRWFMRGKAGYQDTGATVEIGGMRFSGQLELDPDVKAMLYPYKLERSAGG